MGFVRKFFYVLQHIAIMTKCSLVIEQFLVLLDLYLMLYYIYLGDF